VNAATRPAPSLLIIGDDLSGAADCAVAGKRLGLRCAVLLQSGADAPADVDILAVDADSRRDAPAEAAARQCAAWRALAGPATRLYKKVDSTLRGNLAAEVAALVPLAGLAIVAPALPAAGRTTREGRQWLRGEPVEDTEVWRNEGIAGRADLRDMLLQHGLRVAVLSLAEVRAEDSELAARVAALQAGGCQAIVCDAETDDDLDRIARASARLAHAFWVGSAGLAPALMRALGLGRHPAPAAAPTPAPAGAAPACAPVLTVVGSMSSVSHAQADRLRASAGAALLALELPVDAPDDALAALRDAVATALGAGRDVLVALSQATRGDTADGLRYCQRLAALLAPALPLAGALIATGGETARALLSAAGIDALEIADEIEPGMPLLLARRPGPPLPVVTKAGGFGTPGSLHAAWNRLAGATRKNQASAPARPKETQQ